MNKVFNVNLGGYPFVIDEDAHLHLEQYLDALHQHFRSSEGYEEIMHDIEARLAELFQEQLQGRSIVTTKDVNAAIAIMGRPEDFGAEPVAEGASRQEEGYKTGKRLFRNPEEKVVGGVCSGISAYFGISDPVWIRILFVVLVLSSVGFVIPLYLILWVVVPEASSAADRLAMYGKPVNASSIAKEIEEEFDELSERFSSYSSSKKKVKENQIFSLEPLRGGFHC